MTGKLKDRIKALLPIIIPLFVSAFQRAEDMAIAMEVRGYTGGEGRTSFRQLHWTLKDTLGILFMFVFGVFVWWLRT